MITMLYGCMNRESNLMESLHSWIGVKEINEIVVVDWSSEKSLYDNVEMRVLVRKKKVRLIRVDGEEYYSLASSYNLAFNSSVKNKIVFKCDSDYKNIDASWIKYLVRNSGGYLDNYFIVGSHLFYKPLTGLLVVNKSDFLYYNENFEGWGMDDYDLHERIMDSKVGSDFQKVIFFDVKRYIYHLPHSDKDRTINYKYKDMDTSRLRNRSLCGSKFVVSEFDTILKDNNYTVLKKKKNRTKIYL